MMSGPPFNSVSSTSFRCGQHQPHLQPSDTLGNVLANTCNIVTFLSQVVISLPNRCDPAPLNSSVEGGRMADLRKRFGALLAARRRRAGLMQEELAEAANISVDMISKLESGTSGARFRVIESLASALKIDPAELFTTQLEAELLNRSQQRLRGYLSPSWIGSTIF